MEQDEALLPDISADRPNVARIYDYLLGGFHNFEVDRKAAERLLEGRPVLRVGARVNRAFLRRVVKFLAAEGIDQFLDIGSGIPTVGNVHEIAREINPAARTVYVDIDPVAVEHSLAILEEDPLATAIRADVSRPGEILGNPAVQGLLAFQRPVAVLCVSVLHFVLDNDVAYAAADRLRGAMAPGSYLAVLHATFDARSQESIETTREDYESSGIYTQHRTYDEVQRFFGLLTMVEPGLVRPPLWRPEGEEDLLLDKPEQVSAWAGVGHKAP